MMQKGEATEIGPFGEILDYEWAGVRALSYIAILFWIKGDWMEHNKSMGLSNWASGMCPCAFCHCTSEELHDLYKYMTAISTPFWLRAPGDYYGRGMVILVCPFCV